MKINVTDDHIRYGRRCLTDQCPIALAIIDSNPDISAVEVLAETVYIEFADKSSELYAMPKTAERFVNEFDSESEFIGPFSFDLDEKLTMDEDYIVPNKELVFA